MSLPEQTTLTSRLAALAQRLGLVGRAPRQVLERASHLQLPFQPLTPPRDSIWWQAGPPLHRLVDLPRGALSGPVQEDKALAHGVLIRIVEQERHQLSSCDLRLVDGICGGNPDAEPFRNLEEYAATQQCRSVRIISYKDFIRAISMALPRFLAGEQVHLRQATWRGERLFWAGEHNIEAFACAVAYARRRGLEATLPAELTVYRLSVGGLAELQMRYHVLAMPAVAWSDPAFMGLLLENGIPYARLSLLRSQGAPEFLLLPKQSPEATALGEGLRLAGAPDVVAYLRTLG